MSKQSKPCSEFESTYADAARTRLNHICCQIGPIDGGTDQTRAAASCLQDDLPAVCDQLLNQLVLLAPPAFMYVAMPPDVASGFGRGGTGRHRRRGRLGAAAAAGATAQGDDNDAVVYGSYAAVTLCDCRQVSSACAGSCAPQAVAQNLGGCGCDLHGCLLEAGEGSNMNDTLATLEAYMWGDRVLEEFLAVRDELPACFPS
jgi:hypothetical protein